MEWNGHHQKIGSLGNCRAFYLLPEPFQRMIYCIFLYLLIESVRDRSRERWREGFPCLGLSINNFTQHKLSFLIWKGDSFCLPSCFWDLSCCTVASNSLSSVAEEFFTVWVHVPQCRCGSQRTACRSWLSSSIMWVPQMLRLGNLVTSTFTHRAISPAHGFLLNNKTVDKSVMFTKVVL